MYTSILLDIIRQAWPNGMPMCINFLRLDSATLQWSYTLVNSSTACTEEWTRTWNR